jgi:deoxyribodipyrimidine photolyase-like uncharacterized protein
MSPRDRIVQQVRQMLEQQYLESIGDQSKHEYAGLSEPEKRAVLRAFLEKQIAGSKTGQWVKVLEDIV